MRLYTGTSQQFVQDNMMNQISEKLKNSFFLIILGITLPHQRLVRGETH